MMNNAFLTEEVLANESNSNRKFAFSTMTKKSLFFQKLNNPTIGILLKTNLFSLDC